MPDRVTETEVRAVESGAVSLVATHEPQQVYAGNVHYTASNGWAVTVFNDANQWDYIDELHTAEGRWCDYDDIAERMPRVDAYRPSDEMERPWPTKFPTRSFAPPPARYSGFWFAPLADFALGRRARLCVGRPTAWRGLVRSGASCLRPILRIAP